MSQDPILAGVIGWPIEHSLSPLIHTIWAARAGIDGYYIPHAIPPTYDEFAAAMDGLRKVGFKGVNVTLPHKEHALRYADISSDNAKQAGAANMLTFAPDGSYADNSDISGFAAAVMEGLGGRSMPQSALILGAGGAARGVGLALKLFGVKSVTIANRTREKADAIATDLGAEAIDWEGRGNAVGEADLIVNTTSLGMSGQPPLELDISPAKEGTIVADIVYAPLETPLLKAAKQKGLVITDGLAMLMHQAVPGFRAWFGGEAAVDEELRRELLQELKRQGRL